MNSHNYWILIIQGDLHCNTSASYLYRRNVNLDKTYGRQKWLLFGRFFWGINQVTWWFHTIYQCLNTLWKCFTAVSRYFTRHPADLIEISLISSKFYCKGQQFHHVDMYFIATTWVKLCWLFCGRTFAHKIMVLGKKWSKSCTAAHNNFITASTL